jgi:prepilin-type N-terminal cleavage/methylation domain-containing protein
MMRPLGPPRRGMTLLEMLVTLVIVSLLGAIVAQALSQLGRIERLLQGGRLAAMADSVRAEWVRDTLSALLPGDATRGERLAGSARELSGLSADAPLLPASGLARVRLRLVYRERDDRTELRIDDPSTAAFGAEPQGTLLLAWTGRGGRFRYLDAKGVWQDEWTVAVGTTAATLPQAIALETGLPALPVLVAAMRVSAQPLPTRRDLEAM